MFDRNRGDHHTSSSRLTPEAAGPGKRTLTEMLPVSPKLQVGPAGGAAEAEAERTATAVMAYLGGAPDGGAPGAAVQRAEPAVKIQRAALPAAPAGEAGPAVQEDAIAGARGGGRALPGTMRERMERAFGESFAQVRLHVDDRADQLAASIGARAFTIGNDIFVRPSEFNEGHSGEELIAHELTHVVQQGGDAGGAHQIQRALGLELECSNMEILKAPKGASKGAVIAGDPAKHWKAVYESTMEGTPVVEFVIDPAVSTKPQLETAIGEMQQAATDWEADTPHTEGEFKIKTTGVATGTVQITVGTQLEHLPQMYEQFGMTDGYKKWQAGIANGTVHDDDLDVDVPVDQLSGTAKGFLLIVVDYVKAAWVEALSPEQIEATFENRKQDEFFETTIESEQHRLDELKDKDHKTKEEKKELKDKKRSIKSLEKHHKQEVKSAEKYKRKQEQESTSEKRGVAQYAKALFPVMARNDFLTMFDTIEPASRKLLVRKDGKLRDRWVRWIVRTALPGDMRKLDTILGERLMNYTFKSSVDVPLKRGTWLSDLPEKDQLVGQGLMGIAKLGANTDETDLGVKAPIFEFRRPEGHGDNWRRDTWTDKAKATWDDYVKALGVGEDMPKVK